MESSYKQLLSNEEGDDENKTFANGRTAKTKYGGYKTLSSVSDDSDGNYIARSRKTNTTESRTFSRPTSVWPLAEGGSLDSNDMVSTEESYRSSSRMSYDGSKKDENVNEEDDTEKKFSFRNLSRNQKIILTVTCFTNLLSFLGLSILAPFFPLEADSKNVSRAISGWVFGVFALVQFVASPFFGRLVPIIGSRFMYLSGLFIAGGCTLSFGCCTYIDVTEGSTTFILMCFITRILLALGATSMNNASFVMLVRAFPDNVGSVFGIGEIFTGIGMVTGPAVGGFLYGAGGFILPFIVIGGLDFLALPVIWKTLPLQEDSVDSEEESGSILKLMFYPASIVNSISVVVGASVWSILDPTLEPHLRVFGLTPEIVGVLFLIMAAFYSLSSPLWGYVLERTPDNRLLLIPGFLMCAVGLLLLGPSPVLGFDLSYNELWLTVVSLIILGVASSMVIIPTYDIYIDILSAIDFPEDTRSYGMVSGLWVSMYALGDFAGPSLGGFLFDEIGFEWLATWFALVCVLTSMLILFVWIIQAKCCKKNPGMKSVTLNAPKETSPLLTETDLYQEDVLKTYPPPKLLDASKPLPGPNEESETTFDSSETNHLQTSLFIE